MRKEIISVVTTVVKQRRKAILVAVAALAFVATIIPTASWLNETINVSFPSAGFIRTTGIRTYWDLALQNETEEIQWGTVYPGSSVNITLYLKSISNVKTIFHLQTANWTFLNSTNAIVSGPEKTTPYLNLTWSYNNTAIDPNQAIPVTFTLSVADSPDFTRFLIDKEVGAFAFDVAISAEEHRE